MITFGSLFTGIGGFDLGLERNRMKCLWQVEIDTKCNNVLANHWPNVERHTDVKEVGRHNLQPVDLICGGFPCQDVSVAGRRAGLAGERSGLWWEFHRVIEELRPRWCLIENVPGLLSSNEGRDMGAILWALGELRYGWAYRILDAQYFGVAQRRRRVFIVGCLGDARRAAQVLFEPESCERDSAPSRETGEGTPIVAVDVRNLREQPDSISGTLQAKKSGGYSLNYQNPVVVSRDAVPKIANGKVTDLRAGNPHLSAISIPLGVRRLMPIECERLQGFPDSWTEGQSDSARYKQLGNAVAVPVVKWIGQRIVASEVWGDNTVLD